MARLRFFFRRLRALWRSEDIHNEIAEEMRFHIALRIEENIRRGLKPEEARREAERRFGDFDRIQEEGYDMRGGRWLEATWQDLRYSARTLIKTPGFTAAAVLSLSLGIGANTAIFSVLNTVLIRPLPYPGSEALAGVFNSFVIQGQVFEDASLSPGMYAAAMKSASVFENFGVWTSSTATVTGMGDPEQLVTVTATQGALPALGVPAFTGRWFSNEDDTAGSPPTVIISYGYWQRKFGGDRELLGRTVVVDFVPHQVIGVMPRDFRFVNLSPDLLLPQRFPKSGLRPDVFSYNGIARLKPGVTIAMANQDLMRVWN